MTIKTFLALFLLCVMIACSTQYPYKDAHVSYMNNDYALQLKNVKEVLIVKHKDKYRIYVVGSFGDCYYIFNDSLHYYHGQ